MKAVKTIYEEAAYRKGRLGEGSLVMRVFRIAPDQLDYRRFYVLEVALETDAHDQHYDSRELEILEVYRDSDAIRQAIRHFDFELTQLECYVEDYAENDQEAGPIEPEHCPQCGEILAIYKITDRHYWSCENKSCTLKGGIIDLDAYRSSIAEDDIPF